MMDVTIFWNEKSRNKRAIEKHSTPIITAEDTWDVLRLCVMDGKRVGYEKGVWLLAIEAYHPEGSQNGEGWRYTHTVLAVNSGTEELFYKHLEDNIDAINVDGYPWWVNPTNQESGTE